MGQPHQISGKDLGALAMPGCCDRCFWIKRRAKENRIDLPFQIFPGIFSSIDSYSKNMIHRWFDLPRLSPHWLQELDVTGYRKPPHFSKFFLVDDETGIRLTGSPDGVFVRTDRSHIIVDYKTGRKTDAQDALFPMYEAQLNAYAMIGERCDLAPVVALALIYTEPFSDARRIQDGDCDAYHLADGFALKFVTKIVPVQLQPRMIREL